MPDDRYEDKLCEFWKNEAKILQPTKTNVDLMFAYQVKKPRKCLTMHRRCLRRCWNASHCRPLGKWPFIHVTVLGMICTSMKTIMRERENLEQGFMASDNRYEKYNRDFRKVNGRYQNYYKTQTHFKYFPETSLLKSIPLS